jgi:hypothetical protein
MFKLPIQHISHQSVPSSVINELELIVSTETPIYHRLFMPPPEWLTTANELASYYTTDTFFLQESTCLYRNYSPIQSDFIAQWKELKGNKEFKISYQYLESSWLSSLNESPTFLFTISMYFITSPILFVLTPLILLLFPFLMLLRQGIPLQWSNYYKMFQMYSCKHPLFAISDYFKVSSSQQMNLLAALIFFFVQLYVNVYTLYSFYKNIKQVHKTMILAKQYFKDTLVRIVELKNTIGTLSSYRSFYNDLVERETLLKKYENKWNSPTNLWYCGSNRTFFYELYHTKELTELIDYTIGLHGYLHCMEKLKKLNPCTFSTETKFIKAYYPIQKPIKNTYDLKNMIVTGPNASGKTTFLKMTMINVLMSQQFGCGFYKSATICPYETFACYVNIPDTCGRDSLFQAEARRCKEIIDADKTKRTLCIFDELFSGTNPEEAIATGSSMLRYLVKYSTFDFLLTTHFVELCKELKDEIYMKQMKDYKLKNGISFIKGGIRVLEEMNFPSSIVSEAKTLCG